MALNDRSVKELPLAPYDDSPYVHHCDEWRVREFNRMFPTSAMTAAIAKVARGEDTWDHLRDLIYSEGVGAAILLLNDDGFGQPVDCKTPDPDAGHFSNWSPEPWELR